MDGFLFQNFTTLSIYGHCVGICVWFPLHVFKDKFLFSALLSSRNSIPTEKRGNQDTYGHALSYVYPFEWKYAMY